VALWIFIFFIPAVTMKSWSEEKRMGTIELLMTLPIPLWKIVLGKFFATWIFVSLAIILTFPIWITTCYLGDPDNLLILGAYFGSILMAGGYIALGIFFSSLTNNQIIAFIISIAASFIFTIAGFPLIINVFSSFLPLEFLELISNFSFLSHFTTIQSGYFSLSSFVFFISFIFLWNFLTVLKLSDNS
jgi:ABC-2 type transport system permease protein